MLIEEMRRRAAERKPHEVLARYRSDRFVSPSPIDLRTSLAVDTQLLAAADGFEALELSPVTPLGTSSSIAPSSQNRVLSALRGTEVVSDPTNVLALEIATRWRSVRSDVHLATSQRVIRAQPVPKQPDFTQHFRIFVLASGGLEQQDHAFTVATLARHAHVLLDGLDRLEANGYAFGARRLVLLATGARSQLAERIAGALKRVRTEHETLEHPYYSGGLRFMLWVTAPDGREIPLGDGGTFDWLATLDTNRRAVFVASAIGAQLVPSVFRR